MIPIFIGYDPREADAYAVCCNSIIRHASEPVAFFPLARNMTKVRDRRDGSNDFIYSRFLVPYLSSWTGCAIYLDGDMVVADDIAKLWALRPSEGEAVRVVKHNYETKHTVKYLGAKNENYPRKNWSSVMVIACYHRKWRQITPETIGTLTGAYLHRFQFLEDREIGTLPMEWNWLVGEYRFNPQAKLYHYTLGIPPLVDYDTQEAQAWNFEHFNLSLRDDWLPAER